MAESDQRVRNLQFLAGGGEMGSRMLSHDWSLSPLGEPETWPQSLRSVVGLMLASRFPMFIAWGEELAFLYNDAYAPIFGAKHPHALGRPFREVWSEIWSDIEPLVATALSGEATFHENLHLVMERNGYPEDTWYSFSYSPVREESGGIAGMFCACTETTSQVISDRRAVAERERLESMFEQAPGFMAMLRGPEHRFELTNPAYQRLIGHRHVLGRTVAEALPDAAAQGYVDLLNRVYETGEAFTSAGAAYAVQATPGGPVDERFVDFVYQPVRDADGRVSGIFVEGSDATERMRAEAELRGSEELTRRILASSADCIKVLSLDGRLETMSEGGARSLGYAEGNPAPVGASWPDMFVGEGRTIARDAVARAAAGEPVRFEAAVAATSGEPLLWDTVITPILGEGGRPEKLLGLSRDVTAQKAADAALREGEARLSAIFAEARVGLSEVAVDGRFLLVNDELCRMLGRSPAELIECRIAEITHPEDVQESERNFRSVADTGAAVSFDKRYLRTDGEVIWANSSLTLLRDDAGQPRSVLVVTVDLTERKRAEYALREHEEQLRLATDAAEIGLWDLDVGSDTLFWPPRVKAMFGISPNAPISMQDFYAGLHPDDRDATAAAFSAALDSDQRALYDVEYRTVGKEDGVVRWVAAKGRGQFDEYGSCRRVIGTAIDITARKRTEQQLRELNATLEQRVAERTAERDRMWRATRDLMCVADVNGTLLSVNPAWERLLGWSEDELVGRRAADIKHPDDEERTRDGLARLARGEPIDGFEDRYRHQDGTWRWISWSIEPAGDLIYCAGRDVTAEKHRAAELAAAEAARREADALYRAYFENTAEALFVINVLEDGGFSVEDLNPAHQSGIGLPLAEVQGKRIDEILPPDLAAQVIAHYRHALTADGVYQYREHFDLHGRKTYWDTVLVPVRDGVGRIVRLIGSSRDLTPQLEAEEQLRQSQKMEAMGQLTGGVAHDFNNLLTPIVGSLDMLMRRGLGNEREQRLIGGAMQSAERAKTLVQRLLAFARRQPLQAAAVDLPQLVNGMAGLIGSTLGPKIDIRVRLAQDLPPARGDANQLEMALLNLSVNARDAMPDGGLLAIEAASEIVRAGHPSKLKPGDYVRLSVKDTGTGMSAKTLARAVEPFYSTKGIGKGTGLGLSMVHGLAAQLGGALTIASELGQGTTVDLWLPVSPDSPSANQLPDVTRVSRGRGCALLVDDEDLVRMSTAGMLADLGYKVIELASAEEALQVLRNGTEPDLLVTDHLMPGMSGVELAREARVLKADLPVLVISGYAELDGIAPDLPRLTKPFRSAELAESLAGLGIVRES